MAGLTAISINQFDSINNTSWSLETKILFKWKKVFSIANGREVALDVIIRILCEAWKKGHGIA